MTKSPDHLSTGHLLEKLRERTVNSAKITTLAQVVKAALQLGWIVAISRLLTPEDFGLVAMVMAIVITAVPVCDGGLSTATIQRDIVDQAQVSALFWINTAIGLILALAMVLAAPYIASLYGEEQVAHIAVALSLIFLVTGLSAQSKAVLRRQMRFGALSAIDVCAMTIGMAFGIIAGFLGGGPWALVLMYVITPAFAGIIGFFVCSWRPSLPRRAPGLRHFLRFGLNLTGANLVRSFSGNTLPFFVGLSGGPQVLGHLNRAQALISIPSSQILPSLLTVLQPALSRVAQDNERFARAVLSTMRKVLIPSTFVTTVVVALAPEIVDVVLGANWSEAALMLRLLALSALTEPVAAVTANSLVAKGHPSAYLRWTLISGGVVLSAVLVGSFWGPIGAVAAVALSAVTVRLWLLLYYASAYTAVPLRATALLFGPYLLICPAVIAVVMGLNLYLPDLSPPLKLAIHVPVTTAAYTLGLIAFPQTRSDFFEILRLFWRKRTNKPALGNI